MSQIRVVVCRVNKEPVVEMIGDTLESLQKIVGGDIEMVGIGGNVAIVCNEEGVDKRLPQNRCGILGDFLLYKSGPNGEGVDLSDSDVASAFDFCSKYKSLKHPSERRIRKMFKKLR